MPSAARNLARSASAGIIRSLVAVVLAALALGAAAGVGTGHGSGAAHGSTTAAAGPVHTDILCSLC
jgi:hypothetical protein